MQWVHDERATGLCKACEVTLGLTEGMQVAVKRLSEGMLAADGGLAEGMLTVDKHPRRTC